MARKNVFAVAAVALAVLPHCPQAQEVSGVHPAYTYTNLMPSGFNPAGLGGLDFIGNDGVIATWGGSQKTAGEVWILPGLATGTVGTPVKIDGPLREALGLRVVDGVIYVLTKPELFKYTKQTNGTWTKSSVAKGWAYTDSQWHHFAFALVYSKGSFYFNTGVGYEPIPNENPQRGSTIKVNPTTGAIEALVKGLAQCQRPRGRARRRAVHHRQPGPLAAREQAGPHQGRAVLRVPHEHELHREHRGVNPPAIWLPYGSFSNSPTRPFLLTEGPYKGQMITGDVFHGGIQRYFLEKVNGEYQGACFRFSQGIGYGINEIVPGPDGSLYTAGIGGGCCGMDGSGNWNYLSKNNGLGRLKPSTTVPFEVLAMRSVQGGFELEFTKPAGPAANTASNYTMQSWWYTPTSAYGGNPMGTAAGQRDGRRAERGQAQSEAHSDEPAGQQGVLCQAQQRPTSPRKAGETSGPTRPGIPSSAWGRPNPTTAVRQVERFQDGLAASLRPGARALELPFTAPYRVVLLGLDGRRHAEARGTAPGSLDLRSMTPGLVRPGRHGGLRSFPVEAENPLSMRPAGACPAGSTAARLPVIRVF